MNEPKPRAVAIVSGGLDSVTLVHHLRHMNYDVDVLSFNYGQRHRKELAYASAVAQRFDLKHDIVDLSGLTHLISNSALTSTPVFDFTGGLVSGDPEVQVPEGHYAQENMALTVVPNRNMIMLAIAAGVAVNRNADCVAAGMHAGDHFIYPDCRPAFISAANAAIVLGNEGFGAVKDQTEGDLFQEFIKVPFLHWTKEDIAYRAMELSVPLHMTWSCYKGGDNHCGRCGTCVERLEAIDAAVRRLRPKLDPSLVAWAPDHTHYDDTEYWKTVTDNPTTRTA